MSSYILPQVRVFQQFKQISQDVVGNLNACIIGPHYQLARYSVKTEKEFTKLPADVVYAGEAFSTKYPGDAINVDTDYVKVFFEDIVANYMEFAGEDAEYSFTSPVVYEDGGDIYAYKPFKVSAFGSNCVVTDVSARPGKFSSGGRADYYGIKYYFVPGYDVYGDQKYIYVYSEEPISSKVEFITSVARSSSLSSADSSSAAPDLPFVFKYKNDDGNSGEFENGAMGEIELFTKNGSDLNSICTIIPRPDVVVGLLNNSYRSIRIVFSANADAGVSSSTSSSGDVTLTIPESVSSFVGGSGSSVTVGDVIAKFRTSSIFSKYFAIKISDDADSGDQVQDQDFRLNKDATKSYTFNSNIISKYASSAYVEFPDEIELGDTFEYSEGDVTRHATVDNIVASGQLATSEVYPVWTGSKDIKYESYDFSRTPFTLSGYPYDAASYLIVVAGVNPITFEIRELNSDNVVSQFPANDARLTASGIPVTGGLRVKYASRYLISGSPNTTLLGAVCTLGAKFRFDAFYDSSSQHKTCFNTSPWPVSGLHAVSLGREFDEALEVPAKQSNGDVNWSTISDPASGTEEVLFRSGIVIVDKDGNNLKVSSATPFIEYRALDTRFSETIHYVSNTDDIQTTLGAISMDNPIAQGLYHAVLNSGDRPVYYITLQSDDLAGYQTALSRLETTDDVYSLVPMTLDDDVLVEVQSHVGAMSGPEAKLWRIAVIGVSADLTVPIYHKATHKKIGHSYHADISSDGTVIFDAEDETTVRKSLRVGDELRYGFNSDKTTYSTATIRYLSGTRNVKVVAPEGSTLPNQTNVLVEVWRTMTSAEWAEYIANKIASFADRRVYAIFPPVLWNNGREYPGYIGAAAIAGLISSVPPQQGLTNIELKGFDDIPMVYSVYKRETLNDIADHGGLIIMQDAPEGEVYVRHQVSTAALDGNVLTTELSVTKNLDAISYYLADILDPYVGKYNITPILLEQIRTTVQGALNYLGSYNTGAGLLGPMLLADSEDTKIVGIKQHDTHKDHVIVSLTLDLPLPCNVIDLYLSV